MAAIRSELTTNIEAVESRLDSKIEVLKSEMRAGFTGLNAALENAVLRGELSTTRESPICAFALNDRKNNVVRCLRDEVPFLPIQKWRNKKSHLKLVGMTDLHARPNELPHTKTQFSAAFGYRGEVACVPTWQLRSADVRKLVALRPYS